jgi:hypothetical protein
MSAIVIFLSRLIKIIAKIAAIIRFYGENMVIISFQLTS